MYKLLCSRFFQYYYNATTGEFMYWDGDKQTYLPAPSEDTAHVAKPGESGAEQGKEKGEKKENKVKVAKKIAKVCLACLCVRRGGRGRHRLGY